MTPSSSFAWATVWVKGWLGWAPIITKKVERDGYRASFHKQPFHSTRCRKTHRNSCPYLFWLANTVKICRKPMRHSLLAYFLGYGLRLSSLCSIQQQKSSHHLRSSAATLTVRLKNHKGEKGILFNEAGDPQVLILQQPLNLFLSTDFKYERIKTGSIQKWDS